MSKVISTYGVGSKFTTDALMGLGATATDANGRYYIDGSIVHVELARVIAEAIYIKEIFRDGQSVTGKYTTRPEKGGAIRVPLETPLPFGSRTTGFGGRSGTEGNGGLINVNSPILPSTEEFIVYLNQVNDQMMAFPDLGKEYIPLDMMAQKIASYSDRVAMDRSGSTLAEILAYSIWRSLNGGENIVDSGDLSAENAYANLINKIHTEMDNGDQATGAFTFPTEGRTIIGRPAFINGLFNRNSGVILLGGDLAQSMLKNYDLDATMSSRDYVGTGYKGYAMNFHFQSAPDYIWTLAEKYLGLAEGALAKVQAIAVSFDATAKATGVDLGVQIVPATEFRGSLAQPLNIWGHEAFRKSFIIGDSTVTNDYLSGLGFTDETRKRPVAPKMIGETDKIMVPVYDSEGKVVAYREVAQAPKPNGGNIQSGVPHVLPVMSDTPEGAVTSGTDVTLSCNTIGAEIYYTTNGQTPTKSSTKYSAAIGISSATTIKAIAFKDGMVASPVSTFKYTIAG